MLATGVLCALLGIPVSAQDIKVSAHAVLQPETEDGATALAFSGRGALLLSGDKAGAVYCWDLEKKQAIGTAKMEDAIVFLSFLSGDRTYVAVDASGVVSIFDMLKGPTGTTFQTKGTPTRIAIDAGKQYLAVATKDEHIELFDLKGLLPAGSIDASGKIDDVLFIGFDRLGQQIVAVMDLGDVVAWNPSTQKTLRTMALAGGELHGSQSVVHAAATNRATNVFAVSLEEVALPKGGIQSGRDLERRSAIIAYDWKSGTEVKRVKMPFTTELIALGPGNDHVAAAGEDDNTIALVDLRKGEMGSTVTMQQRPRVLSVSDDNAWLAAGGKDGAIAVWKLKFKGEATAAGGEALPALGGRIRARGGTTEPALRPDSPVKLAILSFKAKGMPPEVADVCVSTMSNALANVDYITLVERDAIEAIVKEQQFQLSGLTEDQGVSVGKILKADVVLLGNVGKLGTSIVFSARLINVETGKVMKGREVICEECRDQDMYDAINMLVSTIARVTEEEK
jgi:WD40 repeat protein